MNPKLISCHLRIWSELSLEELGDVISRAVLGGAALGGREDFIRDEIPAIHSLSDVLGSQVVLMGEPDQEGYVLEMTPNEVMNGLTAEAIEQALTDVTPLIKTLLAGDSRIRCG